MARRRGSVALGVLVLVVALATIGTVLSWALSDRASSRTRSSGDGSPSSPEATDDGPSFWEEAADAAERAGAWWEDVDLWPFGDEEPADAPAPAGCDPVDDPYGTCPSE